MAIAAAAGALIGRNFARVSCLPPEATEAMPCPTREIGFAVVGGLAAAVGVAIVIVLVIRSLGEWREVQDQADQDQTAQGDD